MLRAHRRPLPLLALSLALAACSSPPASVSPSVSPSPLPAASSLPSSLPSSPSPSAPPPLTDDAPALVTDTRSANTFTTKLYARVRTSAGNVLISGTSLRSALAIAALGARTDTQREMAVALEVPADAAQAAAMAKAEALAWQDARGKAELVVANRLWSDTTFDAKPDFTALASSAFGASVERVDFAHAPDVARRSINTWVAEKTADKIKVLVPEGAVDRSTRLVITNAIYFKGRWASVFDVAATRQERFTAAPSRTFDVPMMHASGLRRAAQVGAVKVLDMSYEGSALSMLVVLPDDAAGLAKLEAGLTADTFDSWTKALKHQRVATSLPKFSFESGGAFTAPLQQLGMKTAFTSKADFGGIADPRPGAGAGAGGLQISSVVQRTWVAVDEMGTEAAAASAVLMSVLSANTGPVLDFKADHPFLFFVYDAKRGRILFAGRVADPRART